MVKYFGTDGIRGKVGKEPITPDFALKLGYAAGKILGANFSSPIVSIGKDTRISGYLFESALEAGLSYAGCDVYLLGPIPTPAVSYLTRAIHLSAGIVISASHNPFTDNGIKFFSNTGTKLDDYLEQKIEEELAKPMIMAERIGKVKRIEDAKGRYIEFCKNTFLLDFNLKKMTIVVDCANGATYQVAPNVFKELGANVIEINCSPNGFNINLESGSTNVNNLINEVKKSKADLGIAFDGDGDRVIFVNHEGKIFDGDKLLYIIIQLYISLNKNVTTVIGTVMTNLGLENKLKEKNIQLIRTKVGDRYVLEELINYNCLLGGESSGHIICFDKHTTGDAIIAALQVLSAIKFFNKSLEDLVDWQEYPQVLINVELNNHNKNYEFLSKDVLEFAVKELKDQGRIIIRKSGTENVVRIMVEATNLDIAQKYASLIADSLK